MDKTLQDLKEFAAAAAAGPELAMLLPEPERVTLHIAKGHLRAGAAMSWEEIGGFAGNAFTMMLEAARVEMVDLEQSLKR